MKATSIEAYDQLVSTGKCSRNEQIIIAALHKLKDQMGTCLEISRATRGLKKPLKYLDYHAVHKRLAGMVQAGRLVEMEFKRPISPSRQEVTVYKLVEPFQEVMFLANDNAAGS